jgi:hypothetical protein
MNSRDYFLGYYLDTKTREVAGIELIPGDEKEMKLDRFRYFQQKPRGPRRTAIFGAFAQAEQILKRFLAVHNTTFVKYDTMVQQ